LQDGSYNGHLLCSKWSQLNVEITIDRFICARPWRDCRTTLPQTSHHKAVFCTVHPHGDDNPRILLHSSHRI
jgi:hypothetical protein